MGSDQFWGSGGAQFTVSADYSWKVAKGTSTVFLEISSRIGRYKDEYAFREKANPLHYRLEEKGFLKPFTMSSEWREQDIHLQFDIPRPR